jgi:hypothetical protein
MEFGFQLVVFLVVEDLEKAPEEVAVRRVEYEAK